MKKVLITLSLAGFAASVFAQGTINFINTGSGIKAPVYGVEAAGSTVSKTGNTTAGLPAGTQVYNGTLLSGSTFLAQLFAAPGSVADSASLTNGSAVSTFRTGTAAGFLPTATVSIAGLPADAPQLTMVVRAWDNSSGNYATWAQASVAWRNGLIAAGESPLLVGGPAGGGTLSAYNPVGLQSFNLYFVPEPTTVALAGMGAAALLIFRRRK